MNITIRVRERIVWREKVAGELVRSIEKTVPRIEQPLRRLILDARFNALAAGARDILKKTAARFARETSSIPAKDSSS